MPKWVGSHSKWKKAKAKAKRRGGKLSYRLVTHIYKKMGGKIKKKKRASRFRDL